MGVVDGTGVMTVGLVRVLAMVSVAGVVAGGALGFSMASVAGLAVAGVSGFALVSMGDLTVGLDVVLGEVSVASMGVTGGELSP